MAGLALCLLVTVAVVTWAIVDSEPYVAPQPPADNDRADAEGAARALRALERAVREGDGAAAEALAPAGDAAAARQLRALGDNAGSLRVRDFTVRYVDEAGAVFGDGTWAASVDVAWRFGGFDDAPSSTEVTVRFHAEEGRVGIAGIAVGDGRTPVWMSGPVAVDRSRDVLVLAAGGGLARTTEYGGRARRAVADVRAVLPAWRSGLVVEVPTDAAALDRALDAEPGEYAGIAAVTSSPDGSTAAETPFHVFVNPEVFDRLGGTGAQVVMSHEAVHVATRAPQSPVPLWLLEGFADYVALRDVELPFAVTAGQVIRQVRREGPPAALPGQAEFDSSDSHLGAAYESAWLACVVLAERGGEQALLELYAALHRGADLGRELRTRFGWSEGAFVEAWRERLTDLAA